MDRADNLQVPGIELLEKHDSSSDSAVPIPNTGQLPHRYSDSCHSDLQSNEECWVGAGWAAEDMRYNG